MQQVETYSTKVNMIQKLNEIKVFMNNNQASINPKKFAELIEKFESLETKMRKAFHQDDNLESIISDFNIEISTQLELIKKQEDRIERSKNSNKSDEDNENSKDELPENIPRMGMGGDQNV